MIKIISINNTIEITPDDIKKIISYDHTGGTKDPCSEFEFFDLILNNSQKIRITSMIADLHNFKGFIDKIQIDRRFNRRNYINKI